MPLWPLPTASPQASHPMVTSASEWSTNVPTGSTAHTMGAWTQLIASTTIDADLLRIRLGEHLLSGSASPALMDFGVGASESELVVIPALDVGASDLDTTYIFPVGIPAGSRIAARAQGARTAVDIATTVALFGGGPAWGGAPSCAKWTAYGVDAANSRGTLVQPDASANTWSNWVEIATTSSDQDWWWAKANTGDATTVRGVTNLVQVAAGADTAAATACATNGTLLIETNSRGSTTEFQFQQEIQLPRYAPVPAGTKLWTRIQTSSTTDNDLYVSIYGGS